MLSNEKPNHGQYIIRQVVLYVNMFFFMCYIYIYIYMFMLTNNAESQEFRLYSSSIKEKILKVQQNYTEQL